MSQQHLAEERPARKDLTMRAEALRELMLRRHMRLKCISIKVKKSGQRLLSAIAAA
jgi:hypothetical protein